MKHTPLGKQLIQGLQEVVEWAEGKRELKEVIVEKITLIKLVEREGLAVSFSQSKRMIVQGAVKLNGVTHTNMMEEVVVRTNDVLEVGNRKVVIGQKGGFTPRTKITKIEPASFD